MRRHALIEAASSGLKTRERSTVQLLGFGLFVGLDLAGLGWRLLGALAVDPALSAALALAAGAGVVAALWTAGFRPSIPRSGAYFLVQLALGLVGLLAVQPIAPTTVPAAWQGVAVEAVAVVGAWSIAFTRVGRRVRAKAARF